MTEQERAKRYVERICLYCTRGSLEDVAEDCGYKNTHKIGRSKLEQIFYINGMLLTDSEHYQVVNVTTNTILKRRLCRKSVIDYILRECFFNWYDEDTEAVLRSNRHTIKIVEVV